MAVVSENTLLTAGRDKRVVLWDVQGRNLVTERTYFDWPRSLCISSDSQQVALIDKGLKLLSLPNLATLRNNDSRFFETMPRCITFTPDHSALLIGLFSGGIMVVSTKGSGPMPLLQGEFAGLNYNYGQTQAMAVLPAQPVFVTARADGVIDFTHWESVVSPVEPNAKTKASETILAERLGQVHALGESLASMCISPDGAFMAVGDSAASFSLWDLRVLQLRTLFKQPLAQAMPEQLVALGVALASATDLTPAMTTALQYLELSLQQRFKHDIELSDISSIQVGDFDIEIEAF
jgi:WD40 repeat protein